MKLYLSSYRLGREPQRLRDLVGHAGRAGLVFNACDVFGADRLRNYPREADDLSAIGFECEELDLRQYFDDPTRLRPRLETYDLIWVVGGNTFVLARAMNASRFREASSQLIDGTRLTYAGYSAGACVTGPDLAGIHLMDDANALPSGYDETMSIETLGWLPWRTVPHWRSDHPETDAAELAVNYLTTAALPFRVLTDGDATVIDGDP